ncbi:MAG: hypothetical protein K6F09_04510 [Clostridiales bacterium]|nr:hypothetical protein [Clostridiales bacterium]
MKKIISVFLAALVVLGCFAVSAAAEEEVPQQVEVGQEIPVGGTIATTKNAAMCVVTYTIAEDDIPNVTSEFGNTYAPDYPMTQFRDQLSGFSTGDKKGVYTVLGQGSKVMLMLTNEGFQSASDLKTSEGESADVSEINIDYDYNRTTYYQYTTITGWKVAAVNTDDEKTLDVTLEAIWTTREMTKKEAAREKLHAAYVSFRTKYYDFIGNSLLFFLPKIFSVWAKVLKIFDKK